MRNFSPWESRDSFAASFFGLSAGSWGLPELVFDRSATWRSHSAVIGAFRIFRQPKDYSVTTLLSGVIVFAFDALDTGRMAGFLGHALFARLVFAQWILLQRQK